MPGISDCRAVRAPSLSVFAKLAPATAPLGSPALVTGKMHIQNVSCAVRRKLDLILNVLRMDPTLTKIARSPGSAACPRSQRLLVGQCLVRAVGSCDVLAVRMHNAPLLIA
jgi:hypothetical protein